MEMIIKAGMKLDVPESQSGTYNFDLWKKMKAMPRFPFGFR